MVQFSVYARRAESLSRLGGYLEEIQETLPEGGRVQMIEFTDKKYERIRSFKGRKRLKNKLDTNQLILF